MEKIHVTKQIAEDLKEITSIYGKINLLSVKEWDKLTDKMIKSHPLIISIFMGFHHSKDFTPDQMGFIMKFVATIWIYNGGEKAKQMSKIEYTNAVKKNVEFAVYLEGEQKKDASKTMENYLLHNANSVALAFILFFIRKTDEFKGMTEAEQGTLAMELKSVQDCLENRVSP